MEAPGRGQHSPPSTLGMDVKVGKMVCISSLLAVRYSQRPAPKAACTVAKLAEMCARLCLIYPN